MSDEDWDELSWDIKRAHVLRRDGFECQRCGRSEPPLEVDHVRPRADGGSDAKENLRTLCVGCHLDHHGIEPGTFGDDRFYRAAREAKKNVEHVKGNARERAIVIKVCKYLHIGTDGREQPDKSSAALVHEKLRDMGEI